MARVGCPPSMWLLSIQYVTLLLNYLASESLHWQVPLQMLWGFTPDASMFLAFPFWGHIYYAVDDTFPSVFPERLGRIVGLACGVGDALTYQILDDESKELLFRSSIRPQLPRKQLTQGQDRMLGENYHLHDKTIQSIVRLANEGLRTFTTRPILVWYNSS